MQTVTTTEIEAAVKVALRDLVPRYEPLRSCRWAYEDRAGRKGGRVELMGKATRTYCLVWGVGTPTWRWLGMLGTAYAVRLAVATSYAGVNPQQLQHMLGEDATDLWDCLNRLRDGSESSVPGLCGIDVLGMQNDDADDLGNIYIEHAFTIHWNQATNA